MDDKRREAIDEGQDPVRSPECSLKGLSDADKDQLRTIVDLMMTSTNVSGRSLGEYIPRSTLDALGVTATRVSDQPTKFIQSVYSPKPNSGRVNVRHSGPNSGLRRI